METAVWPVRAGSLRNKRLNQSFDFTSKNYFFLITTKNVSEDNFLEFVLPAVAWRFQRAFYAKTSKMNCTFTSLDALLFNSPSWIFYMLYCNSRVLQRYNNSSKIPCIKSWFFSFKVSQNFIVYESAEDRNLRAFFNQVKNSLSCYIFTI